ncbi:hypothetical protein FRC11_008465 [Ceratobasidium sp. 423]|nr:hypothetical protein FRC11_008465 [Ceratobasidium sp. 423]
MKARLEQGEFAVSCGNGLLGLEDETRPAILCDAQSNSLLPPRTAQCWLPVSPGDKFCVHFAWVGRSRRGDKAGAGVFCVLYIDGVVVERAFCPLKKGDVATANGEVKKCAGPIDREWEICGKFYRGEDGVAYEQRFCFSERTLDDDAVYHEETGIVRVVLYWARPNPDVVNPHPNPTKKLADEVSEALSNHAIGERYQVSVSLAHPVESDVVENDMQVERIDDEDFTFLFHYAHPGAKPTHTSKSRHALGAIPKVSRRDFPGQTHRPFP